MKLLFSKVKKLWQNLDDHDSFKIRFKLFTSIDEKDRYI